MSALDVDYLQILEDIHRRRQLREFLMKRRSHVDPVELGLPRTARRRVAGLRRGEVAELVGVTVDWYRSFSKRPSRTGIAAVRRSPVERITSERTRTIYALPVSAAGNLPP